MSFVQIWQRPPGEHPDYPSGCHAVDYSMEDDQGRVRSFVGHGATVEAAVLDLLFVIGYHKEAP